MFFLLNSGNVKIETAGKRETKSLNGANFSVLCQFDVENYKITLILKFLRVNIAM